MNANANSFTERWDWAVAFLVILTMVRLMVVSMVGQNLSFDEAQYWDWAQSLDFGYYSKPPFVAWAIYGTTSFCGDGEACIKASGALAHLIAALGVLALGRKLFSPAIGFWAAFAYALMPGVSFSSMVVSTDPFLLAFWAWGLYGLVRLKDEPRLIWAALLALSTAGGLLSKYAMMYFLICLAVYIAVSGEARDLLKNRMMWLGIAGGLALFSPNLIWNWANGFPSILHLKENANVGGSLFNPDKGFEFLGSQFGVFGPIAFGVLLVAAVMMMRRWKDVDSRFVLLLSFSLPVILLMTVQGFVSRANANWAATAYPAAAVLITAWLTSLKRPKLMFASLGVNFILMAALYGIAPWIHANPTAVNPRHDIFAETRGWDDAGAWASRVIEQHADKRPLFDDRKVMTRMLYYVSPYPDGSLMWNEAGNINNHYEMTADLLAHPGIDVLLITDVDHADHITGRFESVEQVDEFRLTFHRRADIHLKAFVARHFTGYDR